MSARPFNKLIFLTSIPLIAAYFYSYLSFIAFIPMFYYISKNMHLKAVFFTFFPFFVFIYSGIFKSTHTFYGLNPIISLLLVLLVSAYQFIYTFLAAYLHKKSKLPLLTFPVFLVSLEFIKNIFLYGMPLGNLNILTYNIPIFIKDASIFGSLFIDLKILFVNLGLFYLLNRNTRKSIYILTPIVILLLIPYTKPYKTIQTTVSIVQGNIPQNQKWKENLLQRNLNIYIGLSKNLKSRIVLWPESAYPYLFNSKTAQHIKNLIKHSSFALIFGAIRKQSDDYFNSVILYSKRKILHYDKQKLVPFAEFIPLAKLFGLQKYNLTPGKKNVILKVKKIYLGPMICYEENFSSIARKYKISGADLLTVFTNDAWFDKTPTFFLFPRSDIYRAIENRIWLIRTANTGISFIVNPFGKIVKLLPKDKRMVLTAKLTIGIYKTTFFDNSGYMFGYSLSVLAIFLFLYGIYTKDVKTKVI